MNRLIKYLSCAALLTAVSLIPAHALDIEVQGGWGNFAYANDAEQPETFSLGSFFFYRLAISGENGAYVYYNLGYEQDPILRNRLFFNAGLRMENLAFEIGPFFGITYGKIGSGDFPGINPGLSFSARLETPSLFFANIESAFSMGSIFGNIGGSSQSSMLIQLGFWSRYINTTLNFKTQNYYMQEDGFFSTEDSLRRYFLRLEIHAKNNPLIFTADLGYQLLDRTYSKFAATGSFIEKTDTSNELKSVYLGLQGEVSIGSRVRAVFGGEAPVYSWNEGDMKKPDTFLFNAHAGIIWTLPSSR